MLYVIFATYNGATTLPIMLGRLAEIDAPLGGWRIVASDNRSTDATVEILRSYRDRLPLDVVYEPRAGKNCALNTALERIGERIHETDLVVFTDDDITPEKDWLANLVSTARAQSGHDFFGGAITPEWMAPPPSWLLGIEEEHGVLFARTARNEGPCPAREIWGPNMAVRPKVFARGYRFNEAVGPDGTSNYAMGSETEFLIRLEDAGMQGWFAESARVGHLVRPHQMDREWLLQRAFRAGRGSQELTDMTGRRLPFSPVPIWLLRQYVPSYAKLALTSIFATEAVHTKALLKHHWQRGAASRFIEDGRSRRPSGPPALGSG